MQSLSWQEQLANAIRHPDELLKYVGLSPESIGYSEKMIQQFAVRIPHVFADRIKKNDPKDPILRQVFPFLDEETINDAYIDDPLAENEVQPVQGLLHKYEGRVLSITTGACAIHCRYCFRRHFPYQEASSTGKHWQNSLELIKDDKTIHEVILSGGDPLSLSDRRLFEMIQAINEINHIKRIRFHTRIPVVLPDRLSEGLLKRLSVFNKTIVFVLHINHANEIDDAVAHNIDLLRRFNITLLNQSVLLKGVNDNIDVLINLSEKLIDNQVVPYYLHLLDPVSGASHYDVDIKQAKLLINKMHSSLSGYMIPRLVKEEIGAKGKTNIHF